jgi:hypothetical protein
MVACAAVAFTFAPGLLSAQSFEGVMTFVTRDANSKKADTVVQTVKGGSMRMNGMGGRKDGGALIIDADKKRFMMIDDKERTAMVLTQEDQEKMKAMTEGMAKRMGDAKKSTAARPDAADAGVSITKTGRTETVAGVKCEVYHATSKRTDKKGESDVCLADGMGFMLFPAGASNPMFQSPQNKMLGGYAGVLGAGKGIVKVTSTEKGQTVVAVELIKVDRQRVPASTFDAPAGYQVRSLGDMMGQAAGAMQQMQQAIEQAKKNKPPR